MVRNLSEKLAPVFDKHFAFAIGDTVYLKSEMLRLEFEHERATPARYIEEPLRLTSGYVICERALQQCEGGVQAHYLVRSFNREQATSRGQFFEWELVPERVVFDLVREHRELRKAARDAAKARTEE